MKKKRDVSSGARRAAPDRLAELAVEGMIEKKAQDIVTLDLGSLENPVCKYFVICHGDSHVQTGAIADSVEETVRKHLGEKPWSREGFENSEWILLDYGDVVVHVFLRETREFYRLEELWADAAVKEAVAVSSGSWQRQ